MEVIDLARLAIAPTFVAIITLIGRRAGQALAGFLAALPVVAAPILGLIVAAHGREFGATAALSSAIGTAPTMLFALAFASLAPRLRPVACLAAAYGVYFVATLIAMLAPVNWWFAVAIPVLSWVVILRAFPRYDPPLMYGPSVSFNRRWDLPMRICATFILVATVTGLARTLGPKVAGLVTPFPIITATLAVFSHSQAGPETAAILLRSLVRGLASFVFFFWMVALLLPVTSTPFAFTGSVFLCLALHIALSRFKVGVGAARQ